jgi:hypothetical protein
MVRAEHRWFKIASARISAVVRIATKAYHALRRHPRCTKIRGLVDLVTSSQQRAASAVCRAAQDAMITLEFCKNNQ